MGYAWSIDLENWVRDDNKSQLAVSESGWDSEMVNYPHVFSLNGRAHMLYQGNGMGRSGIGVAVLEDENARAVKCGGVN